MKSWKRSYFWKDLNRHWINPSPNLPTMESAITFCGTVLYEGTNISEGRGTTRSLEVLGAPGIEPFGFRDRLLNKLKETDLSGFTIRPLQFHPIKSIAIKLVAAFIFIRPNQIFSSLGA
jgi:uncharacterized protein YbbC (DUF1343 family)